MNDITPWSLKGVQWAFTAHSDSMGYPNTIGFPGLSAGRSLWLRSKGGMPVKATNMSVAGVIQPVDCGMTVEERLLWPLPCNRDIIMGLRRQGYDIFQTLRILRRAGERQFLKHFGPKEGPEKIVRHETYGTCGVLELEGKVASNGEIVPNTDAKGSRMFRIRQRALRWATMRRERNEAAVKAERLAFVNDHKRVVRNVRTRFVWSHVYPNGSWRRPIGAHAPRRLQTISREGYSPRPDVWDAPPGILQEVWDKTVREKQGRSRAMRPLFDESGKPVMGKDGKQVFGRKGDGVQVWQPASPGPVIRGLRWTGSFGVLPSGKIVDEKDAPEDAIIVTARDMNRAAFFWARRLFKHHIATLNRFDRTRDVGDVADVIVGLSTVETKRGGAAWVVRQMPDGSFGVNPRGWIEDFRNGRELKPEDRGFILALRMLYPNMGLARSVVTEGRTLAKHLATARVKLVQHNPDGSVKVDDLGRTVYHMVKLHDLPMREQDGMMVPHPKVDEWFKRFENRKKRVLKGWGGRYESAPLNSLGTTLECDPKSFRSTARHADPTRSAEVEEDQRLFRLDKIDPSGIGFEDWIWFRKIYLDGRVVGRREDRLRMRRIYQQLTQNRKNKAVLVG